MKFASFPLLVTLLASSLPTVVHATAGYAVGGPVGRVEQSIPQCQTATGVQASSYFQMESDAYKEHAYSFKAMQILFPTIQKNTCYFVGNNGGATVAAVQYDSAGHPTTPTMLLPGIPHYVLCGPATPVKSYGISSGLAASGSGWEGTCTADYAGTSYITTGTDSYQVYSGSFATMSKLYPGIAKNTIYFIANGSTPGTGSGLGLQYNTAGNREEITQPATGTYKILCAPKNAFILPSESPSMTPTTAAPTAAPVTAATAGYAIGERVRGVVQSIPWCQIATGDYTSSYLTMESDAYKAHAYSFKAMQSLFPDIKKNTLYFVGNNGADAGIQYDGAGLPTETKLSLPPGSHQVLCGPAVTLAPTAVPVVPSPAAPGPLTASSQGDPHFKTWSGYKFDFHGGCTLVLLENKEFGNGLGLSIHIRTKIASWWSFIEAVVVQIGDQMIELKGGEDGQGPQFFVNGLPAGFEEEDVENDSNLKTLVDQVQSQLPGFEVHYHKVNSKKHRFRINLNRAGDALSLETYLDFVGVNVKAAKEDNWKSTVGLMGSYPSGAMLARDGVTDMKNDTDTFGKEWQVQAHEGMLFHTVEGVQHPMECVMPSASEQNSKKRRLGESALTREDAYVACGKVNPESFDMCVFDVLATNDKDMAGSY